MENIEFANSKKPYLFRYRSNNENTLSEINESYIYFPSSEKLNDPFDGNHNLINIPKDNLELKALSEQLKNEIQNDIAKEFFKRFYEENPEELYQFISHNIKAFFSNFGIACFTISPVNLMLWAAYANNHKGICIQYNTDLDKSLFDDIRLVEYVKQFEKIIYNPATENNSLKNLFFKKLEVWKNETELRVIKEQSGRHIIKSKAIRSIAFGLRVEDKFKEDIIKIVRTKHNHIKLYESGILQESYGLSFTQL